MNKDSGIVASLKAYALHPGSRIHGPAHWARVSRFGEELSRLHELTDEDRQCVSVFAWTHDLARTDDEGGGQHAFDGARYLDEVWPTVFPNLSRRQVELVRTAIRYHSDGLTAEAAWYQGLLNSVDRKEDEAISVVGCCWDADRLDLLRLGARPRAEFMSTEYWQKVLPLAEKLHREK